MNPKGEVDTLKGETVLLKEVIILFQSRIGRRGGGGVCVKRTRNKFTLEVTLSTFKEKKKSIWPAQNNHLAKIP